MRYKLEKLGCYVLIIFLLPYIITVFLNGPVVMSHENNVDNSSLEFKKYGMGVLAREIPTTYEAEAIKAQAIMVRTNIYKEIQENGEDAALSGESWSKTDMKEAWGLTIYTNLYNKMEEAWDETEGQVLLYEEKLMYTPFFSLSNGSTRDGEEVLGKKYPYLKIKDCPLDIEVPEQLQTVTLDTQENIKILSTDTAGYVLKVRVGKEEVSGEEFRKNYKLASSCFSVHEYEGTIRITTRGVGHGIGLSQNTANKMAEDGKSAEEILQYFYEGCEIQEIADIVNK